MAEVKGTNFRLNQEDADQFRIFCESKGWNQAQGFNHLMTFLELDRSKEAIPERKTEICDFEQHANAMVAAFLHSLELNQNAEERIRMEFQQELERNKILLDEKIEQITALKEEKRELAGAAEQVKQLLADLAAAQEQAQRDRMAVADRDLTIKQLTANNEILQIKGEAYDSMRGERDALANQLRDANQEIKDMKKDHTVALERASRAAEKAQDAAVAAARAEGDALASELREQLQEARIAGAQALQEAERQAHEADRVAAAEIRRLEQDNARLRELLAELRAKLPKEG